MKHYVRELTNIVSKKYLQYTILRMSKIISNIIKIDKNKICTMIHYEIIQ